MSSSTIGRRVTLGVPLLVGAALAVPGGAPAVELRPRAVTGAASHVLPSSALLNATIDPDGIATSYYFRYGPTAAYGSQTPTVSVGSGTVMVKVGQAVARLQQGVIYHFRVVAVYEQTKLVEGRDRTFTPKMPPLTFVVAKGMQEVVGTPFIFSGSLTGFGSARHAVVLQASPYPYLEAFTNIGAPAITDGTGRFSFRVANLSTSTQFRVVTQDPRPIYSHVITVRAAVRVTLKVRSSGHGGLVRLFGTVTPAVAAGAQVEFQVQKKVRPRSSEESETPTTRYVSQFTTVVKKGNRTFSRFSIVTKIRHGGRYRAFVKLRSGPLASGFSTQTVVLHATPGATLKAKTKH